MNPSIMLGEPQMMTPDLWWSFLDFFNGTFLSEVNNRETISAIEANNDTYCLQKRIENFPLF